MFNLERSFEFDNTADLENDRSRYSSLDRRPKTTLDDRFIDAVILRRCDDKYLAAPAPIGELAQALSFREGGCLCLG